MDTGQTPLAPEDLTADQLNWQVYRSVIERPKISAELGDASAPEQREGSADAGSLGRPALSLTMAPGSTCARICRAVRRVLRGGGGLPGQPTIGAGLVGHGHE